MSLPWRKPNSGRILRFISELQRSPNHGRALFVGTVFPTSLIDLFFENRDRLKNTPSKHFQRIGRQIQTAPKASSQINQDAVLEKPPKMEALGNKIEVVNLVHGGKKTENKQRTKNRVCGGIGEVVLMAFKVFIVALLALSTMKKLTIRITLFAFALLLTELVATRVFIRFKLCFTGKDKNDISREKIQTFDDSKECRVEEETRIPKSIPYTEETENPKSKHLTIRDILSKDEKSTGKSSRLKSKIVKKLRSCKKKKLAVKVKEESLTQVSSVVLKDKSTRIETGRGEEKLNPPLMGSKGDRTNVIIMIVIVLTGLLCGKILAIVLTLSCLVLRFGVEKISTLCI